MIEANTGDLLLGRLQDPENDQVFAKDLFRFDPYPRYYVSMFGGFAKDENSYWLMMNDFGF